MSDSNLKSNFLARRDVLWGAFAAGGTLLASSLKPGMAAEPGVSGKSPYIINLGDYAKGDGSDETAAIQAAFDAIPSANAEHFGAELYIPRPPKFYGFSKTILIQEKWNCVIRCATPSIIERVVDLGHNHYFHWLGGDNEILFRIDACKGLHLLNLSINGYDKHFSNGEGYVGRTSGVTGLMIGPPTQAGFSTDIMIDALTITNVNDGVVLGEYANNGPDVRTITFRQLLVLDFASRGLVMQSGNLASITLINPCLFTVRNDGVYAEACIEGRGGEILALNMNNAGYAKADIHLYAGGIQVIKAWSEVYGPFLKTETMSGDLLKPEVPYFGGISYPIILEGCRHYKGVQDWIDAKFPSVVYDLATPLHLIGCVLYRDVELGDESGATIIDQGTLFIVPTSKFTGPGITRHHRLVSVGTRDPKNARILQPYFEDRRNVPGVEAPTTGIWATGDGVVNIEPDPSVPAKACRGWTCIKGGAPGKWMAYGALVS